MTSAPGSPPGPEGGGGGGAGLPLPFEQKEMVDWLHPKQLVTTGIRAVLSGIFGSYADKRELQAAMHPPLPGASPYDADFADHEGKDFWFDYAADVGDGFSSTYAIAWLLARDGVLLPGEARPLPRGSLLVLGGDEVYPTAHRDEYENRFRGPYEAAFPGVPEKDGPKLLAVPGNHDWYDGLTSFIRLFCQGRGIGRWATCQTRSYFAVRLPGRWWLWGVDIQLESDIDRPQMDFFKAVAEQMKADRPGAEPPRLILCTGQPTWTDCGADRPRPRGLRRPRPERFDNLAFFEERIIRRHGIRLVVTLSGDLHHYMRYAEAGRVVPGKTPAAGAAPADPSRATQRITSGGGGAYLYPTHHLPEAIEVPEGDARVSYRRRAMFPGAADSHRLARGVAWLPFRNLTFAAFLGAVYLLFAWTLQSASKGFPVCSADRPPAGSLMECVQGLGVRDVVEVLATFGRVLQHSPSNVVLGLVVVLGLFRFRASQDPSRGRFWGAAHGLLHVVLCGLLIWGVSVLNLRVLGLSPDRLPQPLLFGVLLLVGGGIAGAWLFAFYLWASSRDRACHMNEVFSSQHLAGYKNFLRLRIDPEGMLTIHAVGVPDVPETGAWLRRPGPEPGRPLFDPPGGSIPVVRVDGPVDCR